jgi:Fe-S-cluster containining protein
MAKLMNDITRSLTLKDKLNQIYYGAVNLDSKCKNKCNCCRIACPSMNFCEFSQIINEIWSTISKSEKIEMICRSIEYFFHNQYEKFGMQTLIKPCMLLKGNQCGWYASRPLNCRLYGLWPNHLYKSRVDKFEKAYKGLLKRKELPLNKQCSYVERTDSSKPLTEEIINRLFQQLDALDIQIGNFSKIQVDNKENYRAFHDWLLLKIFGQEWLINLTSFMVSADKKSIEDLIEQLKKSVAGKFAKNNRVSTTP